MLLTNCCFLSVSSMLGQVAGLNSTRFQIKNKIKIYCICKLFSFEQNYDSKQRRGNPIRFTLSIKQINYISYNNDAYQYINDVKQDVRTNSLCYFQFTFVRNYHTQDVLEYRKLSTGKIIQDVLLGLL